MPGKNSTIVAEEIALAPHKPVNACQCQMLNYRFVASLSSLLCEWLLGCIERFRTHADVCSSVAVLLPGRQMLCNYGACDAGNVSMTCVLDASTAGVPLAVYLAPSVLGALLVCIVLPLAFVYWRRLAGDVANYKQIWHKRRYLCMPCLQPIHSLWERSFHLTQVFSTIQQHMIEVTVCLVGDSFISTINGVLSRLVHCRTC